MDCILRVIKGPDTGTTCRLVSGQNLVGRSSKAALKLTPEDISWEHLSVTRNGDQYIAENLSALGSYLDEARLTAAVKLRAGDQFRLSGNTVIRFEAVDGGGGMSFLGRKGLPILLVLLALGFLGPEQGLLDALEIDRNPRSRSAKLRVAERLAPAAGSAP